MIIGKSGTKPAPIAVPLDREIIYRLPTYEEVWMTFHDLGADEDGAVTTRFVVDDGPTVESRFVAPAGCPDRNKARFEHDNAELLKVGYCCEKPKLPSDVIEAAALAVFKSTFHPIDAANAELVAQKREEWNRDWERAEDGARAALEAGRQWFFEVLALDPLAREAFERAVRPAMLVQAGVDMRPGAMTQVDS